MRTYSGIVLAGGRSTRMGADKASLTIRNISLLDRAVALLEPLVDDVIVVTRAQERTAGRVRVVADEIRDRGPMAGLLTGLHAVRHPEALVVPVDLPLLPPAFLKYLAESSYGWDITVPRWRDGIEPLVGVYAVRCAPLMAAALRSGQGSMQDFVTATEVPIRFLEEPEVRQFGDPARLFFNVNTPEDARVVESLLAAPAAAGDPS